MTNVFKFGFTPRGYNASRQTVLEVLKHYLWKSLLPAWASWLFQLLHWLGLGTFRKHPTKPVKRAATPHFILCWGQQPTLHVPPFFLLKCVNNFQEVPPHRRPRPSTSQPRAGRTATLKTTSLAAADTGMRSQFIRGHLSSTYCYERILRKQKDLTKDARAK